jgi:hypothetical protein
VCEGLATVLIGPNEILPCDVETLKIQLDTIQNLKSIESTLEPPKPLVVEITRVLRLDPVPEGVPKGVAELLNKHDLVIDRVAGFRSKESSQDVIDNTKPVDKNDQEAVQRESEDFADTIKITASSTYHMSCSRRLHPLMRMVPLSTAEELPTKLEKRATELPPQKFNAEAMTLDFFEQEQGIDVLVQLFQFIRYLFGFGGAKLILVEAEGCGSRALGAGTAKQKLGALVRIYRKDEWSLEIKFPARSSKSYERETSKTFFGDERGTTTKETVGNTSGYGKKQSETTTETKQGASGQSTTTTNTTWSGNRGTETESTTGTDSDGKQYGKESKKTVSKGSDETEWKEGEAPTSEHTSAYMLKKSGENLVKDGGVSIVLTRNGREFECDLLNLAKRATKQLNSIKQEILDALEALRQGPQIGWKLSASLAFLEGSIKLSWEPEEAECIGDRYWPVENKWTISVSLLIVSAEVELSFGLEFKVWKLAELTAKVYAKLSGELSAEFNATWAQDSGAEITPKLTITGEVGVVLVISALGWSIIDAGGSAEAGIEVEVKIGVSQEKGMYFEMDAKLTEGVAKIHVSAPFGIRWSKRYTMWNERPLIKPIRY